jgi:hypothetical protein
VAKLIARPLATAALVRIQAFLKNQKWATQTKEWQHTLAPPKSIQKIFKKAFWKTF